MTPGRIATILAIVAGIATAITPAVANMDWTSTAGVIAGGIAIVGAIVKWLDGWQKWERTADRNRSGQGEDKLSVNV